MKHLKYFSFFVFFITSCSVIKPSLVHLRGATKNHYLEPTTYGGHRTQQQYLETKDGKIAYTDTGKGKVLVLFHGVPTSSWLYRKIIPDLQKSYRVISIDFLGYGSSAKPTSNGNNYTASSQAERVQLLMKHLNIPRYSIMMHDMGGLVAWELVHKSPQSIANLIVLDTIVTEKGFKHPNMKKNLATRVMTNAYSMPSTSAIVLRATFHHMGLKKGKKLTDKECAGYVIPMEEGSKNALYPFFTSINPELFKRLNSFKPDLRRFKGNTLVLWGAKDPILTTKQIPYLKKHLRITDKNIHIYPNHSHFLPEEMPKEIIKRVKEFLPQ